MLHCSCTCWQLVLTFADLTRSSSSASATDYKMLLEREAKHNDWRKSFLEIETKVYTSDRFSCLTNDVALRRSNSLSNRLQTYIHVSRTRVINVTVCLGTPTCWPTTTHVSTCHTTMRISTSTPTWSEPRRRTESIFLHKVNQHCLSKYCKCWILWNSFQISRETFSQQDQRKC